MNFSMIMILFGLSAEMLEGSTLLRRLQGSLLCQAGQVYDYPYNNGNIKICQNGQTILNFVGTSAQCHCPEGTWNDNYTGRCITTCHGSADDANTNTNTNANKCQLGSGQIYGIPPNGFATICQNGKTVSNDVGLTEQCHCPVGTWNDNYSGQCIDTCQALEDKSNDNLCQSNSGQIYDYPYNNGHVKICLNGKTIWNFIGTDEQCHCPEGEWNDNYKGNCINYCPEAVVSSQTVSHSSNLCQIASGQIFGLPYNNGFVNICQNGQTILNFVGLTEQCHCPEGTWNDNFTGQCITKCESNTNTNTNNNNNNLCQIGSGQIFGVPYNNGFVKICQNGRTIFNFVGKTEQCHCPQNKWNDNYTGQCINSCH